VSSGPERPAEVAAAPRQVTAPGTGLRRPPPLAFIKRPLRQAGNVMTRPRQQRATGTIRGAVVLAVLLAMLPLCLARVHHAATASSLGTALSFGVGCCVPTTTTYEIALDSRLVVVDADYITSADHMCFLDRSGSFAGERGGKDCSGGRARSGGAGEARRGGVHQRLPGEPCQRPAQPVPSVIHTPSDPSSRACASSQYCSLSFDRVRGVLVSHLHACVSPPALCACMRLPSS
jgi:hypothetical protein